MGAAGLTPSNTTLTVLISSLLRSGATDKAVSLTHKLLQPANQARPYDLPLYNTMLQALFANREDAKVSSPEARPLDRCFSTAPPPRLMSFD